MYHPCTCGNRQFNTTKTVHHDLTVTVDDKGNLIDGAAWVNSTYQPDEPYFYVTCTACDKTYHIKDLETLLIREDKESFLLKKEAEGNYTHPVGCGNCGAKGYHEPGTQINLLQCHSCDKILEQCDCPDWECDPRDVGYCS